MTILSLLFVLVVMPAVAGYYLYLDMLAEDRNPLSLGFWRHSIRSLFHSGLEPGDFLIYRKAKTSAAPGPRARNVHPAETGEGFLYEVEKFWRVADVLDDGRLVAATRTGKRVFLMPQDESVRKARLIERVVYHRRFPTV